MTESGPEKGQPGLSLLDKGNNDHRSKTSDNDWALEGDQFIFMFERHNAIMGAIERDDDDFLLGLADSEAFKKLFGSVGWDEAFDRYEAAVM